MATLPLKSGVPWAGRFIQPLAVILLVMLLTGCFASFGNYNRDGDVFRAFNTDQVPADYRYYYYHSGSEPIAVIGVD